MEILGNFGFEPTLFFAQIINFLILAFVFKKFLYKPILKTLKKRQQDIAQGLKNAEDAEIALTTAEEKKDKIVKKARTEAAEILEETKTEATKLKDQIISEAKADAQKIIESAHNQAEATMEDMEKRAKKASIDNSVALLSKVLEPLLGKDDRQKILTKSMKELHKYD